MQTASFLIFYLSTSFETYVIVRYAAAAIGEETTGTHDPTAKKQFKGTRRLQYLVP